MVKVKRPIYEEKLKGIDVDKVRTWIESLAKQGLVTKIDGTGTKLDGKWFGNWMADVHGTLGCLSSQGGSEIEDIRQIYTKGVEYKIATEFDKTKVTKWEKKKIGDAYEALRVKIVELLGSEGPKTDEELTQRLPIPKSQITLILHELEIKNVVSVGFFRQTNDAEFILRVDEHKITGGSEDVVDYRELQNFILNKSFRLYEDPFAAFDSHLLFQKPQEMLDRVNDFRFGDWKDIQIDSDVVMGRLLHNRIGYTSLKNIPMLLGLRPEPWMNELEQELYDKMEVNQHITRKELLEEYPRGEEHLILQRELRNALANLERQLLIVKQFEEIPERKRRVTLLRKVHEEPLDFKIALFDLIKRIGPVKLSSLRMFVSRSEELLAEAIREMEAADQITKIVTLQPEPTTFFAVHADQKEIGRKLREDRKIRILTQSDPYCSRFIWEVRRTLKPGWYLPVFKGIDPVGKILMYKVNDYLEIKDMQMPFAYLDEFCESFEIFLDNYRDQLVDVAVLTNFNGEPILDQEETTIQAFEEIGFKKAGNRMIRGGVIDPKPREIAERALFYQHHLHQKSRLPNETMAVKNVAEIRDDFALRGRCEMYRVDLKSMVAAEQLHMGINLRGHQVWAPYKYFQKLLTLRGLEPDPELLDILDFFGENSDPKLFMERHAMSRTEFRKLIRPLIRSGHLVQDYREGFRTVDVIHVADFRELRKDHLREIVEEFPVLTLRQFNRLAGTPFKPEELKEILREFEEDETLIKGFLIQDLHEICWGRKELLADAEKIPAIRDFVLPPSDPLAPYFSDVLRQRFGFGSAYLVFKNGKPVAAFKANTRDASIDVTDFEGEAEGWRIVKEFAWEHQLPLSTQVRIAGKLIN